MRRLTLFGCCLLLTGTCLLQTGTAFGQAPAEPAERPLPEEGHYLYKTIPDVKVIDSRGQAFQLADRWRERPLVVTLVFASCTQICPPYIHSLKEAVSAAGQVGDEYDVVVLSFDPYDTVTSMAAVARLHGLEAAAGWTFGVTSADEIERLSRSIGFWSDWDEDRRQFDHPALLAGIDQGRVVRLLVGADVSRRRFSEVLWELRRKFVATYPLPSDKVWFRCFTYDPQSGSIGLDWGLLFLLAPGLVMLSGTLWIFGRARQPGREAL